MEFSDLRNKRFFEIDHVIIWTERRKFSCVRFFKDCSKLSIFWRKDGFWFGEFCLYG